ncbi:hypothetical protein DJ018_17480 [Phenylobacterium deserti]|uniref:Uncharacterized protein n=2 Tax=Phenylobacterium deserti TaxID=1914756 RepID=A0A328A8J6_9CAUL|nr:hypothetical protein DJ018_17480 [Phenylobacterium deserti]
MEGVWLNTFEGSAFYEGATSLADARGEARVWFRHEEPLIAWKGAPPKEEHAYRVVLIGRSAEDMNRPPLQGYGHMGLWPGLVVVDELLELQDLGPLRPG